MFRTGPPEARASGFVFYLGIPDVSYQMVANNLGSHDHDLKLEILFDTSLTLNLVSLLLKNHWDQDIRGYLNQIIDGHSNSIPMFASGLLAQRLAFFANNFNMTDTSESSPMLLLALHTDVLLGGAPPFASPLGSFWLANVPSLTRLIQTGKAVLTVEPFCMRTFLQPDRKPMQHSEVRAESKASGLHKRKALLEECVSHLTEELTRKRMQLKQVHDRIEGKDPIATEEPAPELEPSNH